MTRTTTTTLTTATRNQDTSTEKCHSLAERLRRQAKAKAQIEDCVGDIDDEIQRLEAELAADDNHDDSNDDDDDDDDGNHDDVNVDAAVSRPRRVRFSVVQQYQEIVPRFASLHGDSNSNSNSNDDLDSKEPCSTGIICLSEVSDARIEGLPKSCLPSIRRKRNSGIVAADNDDDDDDDKQRKGSKKTRKNWNGLQEAVKEVLSGYVARSSERLPFYCRVCLKQYDNETEFMQHKKTEFHKVAVEVERKASFCKLCRKQFTSPVQLKEHLSSKPHKDRLLRVQERQKRVGQGSRQWS